MKWIFLFFCCGWTSLAFGVTKELVIRHAGEESVLDERYAYYVDMLDLALQKSTSQYGPYRLEKIPIKMVQGRALLYVSKGKELDVGWSMTSKQRENILRPIRIPLLKGLLGNRIFLIRQGEQFRFSQIKNLGQLKSFKAGQGHDWPDTKILQANGLKVIKGSDYEGLFNMLINHRFDYFPRGVNEPFIELESRPQANLVVEQNLLIRYPAPVFFFTHRDNVTLAKRLEFGLKRALADGSFDQLFDSHPSIKKIFRLANLPIRQVFQLNNPFLTPETRLILNDPTLWYLPKQERR